MVGEEGVLAHLTVPYKKVAANSVPEASVIRGLQALSGVTGRKGSVGGLPSYVSKTSAYQREGT